MRNSLKILQEQYPNRNPWHIKNMISKMTVEEMETLLDSRIPDILEGPEKELSTPVDSQEEIPVPFQEEEKT